MRPSWIIGLAVALTSCASVGGGPASSVESQGSTLPVLAANISPVTINARLIGTIRLSQTSDTSFDVAVDLRGGRPHARMTWMIRTGQCGVVLPGSEVGPAEAFGVIAMQADGEAHVRLTLRIPLPDEELRVDLGPIPARRETVEACGLLVRVR